MAADTLHVVVFPWLAFGHMLPFLELSKSLARRGHRISFISTPRNIQRLPKLPPQISHLITLIPLDLPQTEGLREAAEASADLPPEEVPYLKKALDGLEQPFSNFIKEASPKPDWIVQDFAQHWIPAIGAKFGIPCIFYVSVPAAVLVFYGPRSGQLSRSTLESFTESPAWVPFPSKVSYRPHEVRKLLVHASLPNPSGVNDMYRFNMATGGCKAIAVRSCMELEREWLCLLREIAVKPVFPVGVLPPSVAERSENANGCGGRIMAWLDKQKSRSVVYVALGSEVAMSVELLQELALGLEAAKMPFIWALRRPFGLGEDVELLPQGFEERTEGFGIVSMSWVPQVKILAHESVGGFATHCGWSSLIEGIHYGKPFVLLPIDLDQGLNARLMEEKGIGVEVEKDEEDGSFTREDVSKALRLIMVECDGETYRRRAQEMMQIVANKERHEKYMEDFVQYLASHRSLED